MRKSSQLVRLSVYHVVCFGGRFGRTGSYEGRFLFCGRKSNVVMQAAGVAGRSACNMVSCSFPEKCFCREES